MSDLTTNERRLLETYFVMGGGYFLEFSNNSLADFVSQSINVDLYSEKYNRDSGSKANRMRALWDLESNYIVGKLVKDIIEDDDDKGLFSLNHPERDIKLRERCLDIAKRLMFTPDSRVPQSSAVGVFPPVQEKPDFNQLKSNIFGNAQTQRPRSTPQPVFNPDQKTPPQSWTQPAFTPPKQNQQPQHVNPQASQKDKVFIVHGRDEHVKEQVARFVEQLDLEAIILHEQSSGSDTIIEKIERYSEQASYGIVIYTPCDTGGLQGESHLKNRARQNVVFEHGYLMAKLNRKNVTALIKGDVEIPNDISGVVYEKIDAGGAWKLKLAKEMKDAGCSIDMNKL
ncbi:TIR domain-containing protein [Thalassotalea euphylliae]|uniref:TIR domain-containing protein n=1 Tax=Thalassotalea euphylliae TaxID=1655234 RepID=UPI00362C0C5D